jgi:hypothetical protein
VDSADDLRRRVIHQALRIAGGEPALAFYLCVDPERIEAWCENTSKLPHDIFVALVEFLLDDHGQEWEAPSR